MVEGHVGGQAVIFHCPIKLNELHRTLREAYSELRLKVARGRPEGSSGLPVSHTVSVVAYILTETV